MTIRAVIWDMDGVLVDTGEYHYRAWADTLDLYKIPFTREQFDDTFGMNNRGILEIIIGPHLDQNLCIKISDEKEDLFRRVIRGKVEPLPGVVKTLDYLRSRGIRQAIASSAPPENIDALVDELHLRSRFDAILSGYQMDGKPAPDVFLAAARAIDVPPYDCLVIEDAVTGVEGAKRASMACLAVTNTHSADDLKDADRVVGSLLELKAEDWDELLKVIKGKDGSGENDIDD
jgi:beta-phosphoglucomutase